MVTKTVMKLGGGGGAMIKQKHLQKIRVLVLKRGDFFPFSTREHLAVSGDIFDGRKFGGGVLLACGR